MEQMKMTGLETVTIDFDHDNIPASVKEFRPAVFKDGDSFCCLLGPDPQEGVFGCGSTAREALADWDVHLRERAKQPKDGDPLDEYIQDTLATSLFPPFTRV
jgi:hypothetical protein